MTRGNSIALIPCIVVELDIWIKNKPTTNVVAHALVKACLSGNKDCGVELIQKPKQEWIADSINYYVNLLGFRKLMWHITEHELNEKLHRTPTAQEISNYIQHTGTSRAQLLAQQGRNPRVPDHLFYDEWLVVMALVRAITSGSEVTIVTSDEAVLDQFFKATTLLTRHYEATFIASSIADSPHCFKSKNMANPDEELLKGSEVTLVENLPSTGRQCLPSDYSSVNVHCMLLQSKVTRCTFRAECGMEDTLRIKHKTGGLSSDRLDGKNFHYFDPRKEQANHINTGVIAEDMTVDAGGPIPIAHADIRYVLANNDTFEEVKYVDPQVLLLPPHY